jgi:hypothetical protein
MPLSAWSLAFLPVIPVLVIVLSLRVTCAGRSLFDLLACKRKQRCGIFSKEVGMRLLQSCSGCLTNRWILIL